MRDTPDIGPGTAQPATIGAIAARLDDLNAKAAALTGPHPDEGRLLGEVDDLQHALSFLVPRNADEALPVAAVAAMKVHDIDELGGCQHERALRLVRNLLRWLGDATGRTVDGIGDDGPAFTDDTDELMKRSFGAGYLAAVRRFAPTAYPFVKRELVNVPAGSIATEHVRELNAANGVTGEARS